MDIEEITRKVHVTGTMVDAMKQHIASGNLQQNSVATFTESMRSLASDIDEAAGVSAGTDEASGVTEDDINALVADLKRDLEAISSKLDSLNELAAKGLN